ncbi:MULTISPECIES: flagellar basal body L-ring protein FlgH [Azorhizobium]|uniref:Flagellar L-ring protein n=1 Tax=Azorhizobium caulinodans (strain ATCC 43989 / DSM 5975 / JCM 20966 / LMG 6465 / NBRC 14845 / NCIMB 13405 / ORS 571) TaxID=438753 RepID=FLGH_AZOC5|nr:MULTISPECIES: flagellar basal body L-ring protein FlgH [Azorhizobium]A8IPJ4.1 RecName: Full=Flagellar L-ring protein; AltName: Full=Basal body L-ring protein; Flags: Precursor [Azorhizobium caulinodans ORS 571]TDT88898.1 flagellar L-ring protein precursor FlgH [Azorhizobium sp. AG788]BAF86628.1 flagellar L-ring protein precursor [Azorhizobium caulinodans ORS 571]
MKPVILATASALLLAACQTNSYDSLAYGPTLTPVGQGLEAGRMPVPQPFQQAKERTFRSAYNLNSQSMYRALRAAAVGDVIRITIDIDDKAQLDNNTNRSRKSASDVGFASALNLSGFQSGSTSGSASGNLGLTGDTSTDGKGKIDRSEKLRLSLAAVVTEVMPNGNLVINGSQEILVNYEVRVLTLGGIVNPLDVTSNNTVAYDKVAEARISYAGRGRLNDVQQPAWGQRLFDAVNPM